MPYTIQIEPTAAKALEKLKLAEQIGKKIDALAIDPRPPGVEKLADEDLWRVRVRTFRVVYKIKDDVLIVVIVKIAPRDIVYKR